MRQSKSSTTTTTTSQPKLKGVSKGKPRNMSALLKATHHRQQQQQETRIISFGNSGGSNGGTQQLYEVLPVGDIAQFGDGKWQLMCQPKRYIPTNKIFHLLKLEKLYAVNGVPKSFNLEIGEKDLEDFIDAMGMILRGFPNPPPVAGMIAEYTELKRAGGPLPPPVVNQAMQPMLSMPEVVHHAHEGGAGGNGRHHQHSTIEYESDNGKSRPNTLTSEEEMLSDMLNFNH